MRPPIVIPKVIRTVIPAGSGERGFVLVTALFFLLLLTLIGTFGLNTTCMEIQISANDRLRRQAFFQADGGAQLALCLLEDGLASLGAALDKGVLKGSNSTVLIENPFYAVNGKTREPADSDRDLVYFPAGFNPATPAAAHTNMTISCQQARAAPGSSLVMVGYQDQAAKGAQIPCTIFSQHLGQAGGEAMVEVDWIHVVGHEADGRPGEENAESGGEGE